MINELFCAYDAGMPVRLQFFFNFEHQIGWKMVKLKQLSREENFLNIKKRDPFC